MRRAYGNLCSDVPCGGRECSTQVGETLLPLSRKHIPHPALIGEGILPLARRGFNAGVTAHAGARRPTRGRGATELGLAL